MIAFRYPFNPTHTLEVELPNPILGDGDRFIGKASHKFSMDGTIRSYKLRPTFRVLTLTWSNLKDEICDSSTTYTEPADLLSFIEQTVGLEVRFEDWLTNVWKGKIVSNPIEEVDGLNFHSLTLEFEGVIQ